MTSVFDFNKVCPIQWLEEAGPSAARFELRIGLEEGEPTADTAENTDALFVEKFSGPWWFRAALSGHMKAFRAQ